ncbi:MAG: ATP-dependent zinc metalloprotease FtsH [Candidatus Marinamargulisbacteria bacterium]
MAKKKRQRPPKKDWRSIIWYLFFSFFVISIITATMSKPTDSQQINFSQFLNELDNGQVKKVKILTSDQVIQYTTQDGATFKSYYLDYPNLIQELKDKNVDIDVNPTDSNWFLGLFLQAFLPFILIGALWFFIFRSAQGASSQAMSFGKSRATPWKKGDKKQKVTFKDIAGVDEAVEELKEIVEFLKKPQKFRDIGAKIPKGALLMGPPGTGKTLLAKAIAGEADVPFFSLSGSDFVEMFVGVGASRVRDLFSQAKKATPSIIFVDEIDAVGRQRGAGLGGGHDEREQTLNALLVEMDGFGADTTVIVIAATNRPDILDPALLRPGRFDRQITVDKPDLKGRKEILEIHAQGKKIEKGVDLELIARRTPGFTGADLANIINEAALLAARRDKKEITLSEIEESVERVVAGPQRKSRIMSDKEKEIVAYHETGHALVAVNVESTDPVHKISILPRGFALGYTLQLPEEDKFLISREHMLSQLKILLGGRIAEEIIFGEITSGASNDIERVTELAKNFVCKYGMSEKLGTRKYGLDNGPVFLGRKMSEQSQDYSDHIAKEIDNEINDLIQDAYAGATKILKKYKTALVEISKILLDKEVIDGPEFLDLVAKFQGPKKRATAKKTPALAAKAKKPAAKKPTTRKRKAATPKPNDDADPAVPISLDKPIDQVG